MIKNRSMDRGAKKRAWLSTKHDLSAASLNTEMFGDNENPIKIDGIDLVYSIATSTHTQGETLLVGTVATTNLYCDITVATSTAAGTITAQTVASTAVVPAGTAIVIKRSAATGTSNTGEVQVLVTYEYVDVTANRG